jgi:hypothetical protein
MIAKSIFTKGFGCKSGGCAAKVVRLTPGDLSRVTMTVLILSQVTEDIVRCPDRAAEVSRGHSRRRKRAGEAGGLTPLKARTDWSGK